MLRFSENAKWGYKSRDGRIVIPPRFDYAEEFLAGRAVVATGNMPNMNWGIIDRTSTFVIGPGLQWVKPFSSPDEVTIAIRNNKYELIRWDGRRINMEDHTDLIGQYLSSPILFNDGERRYVWKDGWHLIAEGEHIER